MPLEPACRTESARSIASQATKPEVDSQHGQLSATNPLDLFLPALKTPNDSLGDVYSDFYSAESEQSSIADSQA